MKIYILKNPLSLDVQLLMLPNIAWYYKEFHGIYLSNRRKIYYIPSSQGWYSYLKLVQLKIPSSVANTHLIESPSFLPSLPFNHRVIKHILVILKASNLDKILSGRFYNLFDAKTCRHKEFLTSSIRLLYVIRIRQFNGMICKIFKFNAEDGTSSQFES